MLELKPVEDVVCVCLDYGNFVSLAESLARSFKKVYYWTPIDDEFRCLARCVYGLGVPGIVRIDDPFHPDIIDDIDLAIFPDVGFSGMQLDFKARGKAVFGAMGASEVEFSRTRFVDLLDELSLPKVPTFRLKGLSNLAAHLKTVQDKWVKINRFRGDTETFHHASWKESERVLEMLAFKFGPFKEKVVFVVQDHIDTEIEIGYDGFTIDGKYPEQAFAGYEKKNELYLGSLLPYDELPKPVLEINAAIAPLLKEYGYRNFMATEIRVKDGVPYYIDPTMRLAGMTMEHQQESATNQAEVIWKGANGIMVKPEFSHKFAAEATMHYTLDVDGGWKTFRIPDSVKQWIKPDHYAVEDGAYHFPPRKSDECGVVIGFGNSIQEAIDELKSHFEEMKEEPVSIDEGGFVELLNCIEAAENAGMKFSDRPIPAPEEVIT